MSLETKIGEVNGEEIVAGPNGGAGSKIPWYELIDARALEEIAAVFTHGAQKYQRDNWRAVPVEEHLRHLIRHAFYFLEWNQQYYDKEPGFRDEQRDELSHMACRAVMALAVWHQDPEVVDKVPKGLASKVDEVQKVRDSVWTGEDVDRAWPPKSKDREINEKFQALVRKDPPLMPQNRIVPRFAEEDGLSEVRASEEEIFRTTYGVVLHEPAPPEPCPGSPSEKRRDARDEASANGATQLRTYSLYDLGQFEMLESDYECRRSSGLWEDREKARQTIDWLVQHGWARRAG